MITVGVDILDGSFEVDFDYWLLSRKGEEPILYEVRPDTLRVRRRASSETVVEYELAPWLTELLATHLQDSGDVYMAVAKNEGIDIS